MGLSVVDTIRGADFQARHLLLALSAGEPRRLARALATEAGYQATTGNNRRRVARCLEASWRLARRTGEPEDKGRATMVEGFIRYLRGEWERTIELMDHATEMFQECVGVAWELSTTRLFSLYSLVYRGDPRGAVRAACRCACARPSPAAIATSPRTFARASSARSGWPPMTPTRPPAPARRPWRAGRRRAFTCSTGSRCSPAGRWRFYTGRAADAHALVASRWRDLERSMLRSMQHTRVESSYLLGRAALAASAADPSLLPVAAKQARRLEREGLLWARAVAGLLRAGIAHQRGRLDEAATILEETVTTLREADLGLHVEAARLHLALLEDESAQAEASRQALSSRGVRPSRPLRRHARPRPHARLNCRLRATVSS